LFIHVEGAADGESFRKDGRTGKHRAVRPLLVLEQRNLQPRPGECDLLKRVEKLSLLPGAFMEGIVGKRE
jgi:hypothetical protein